MTFGAPLSARSVALSMLLGSQPPVLTARDLVHLGEHFGIAQATMRVSLSRMAAGGDVVMRDATYALAPRHLERQRRIEARLTPRRRGYRGEWHLAVVVEAGRSAADRAALRAAMDEQRFAELREGVWMRPDNLLDAPTAHPHLRVFTTVPDDDRRLCGELWPLDAWASRAEAVQRAMTSSSGAPMERLAAAAAAVRHLLTDPALPDELAPARWPADPLRVAYAEYRRDLRALLADAAELVAEPIEPVAAPADLADPDPEPGAAAGDRPLAHSATRTQP